VLVGLKALLEHNVRRISWRIVFPKVQEEEDVWDTYERRLEDPTAAAVRLVEQLLDLAPQAALERMVDAIHAMDELALESLWRVLQLELCHAQAQAATADEAQRETLEALGGAVAEALARRATTAPAANVPSPQKLQAYSALLEQLNSIMAAHSPARSAESLAALKDLTAEVERLRAEEPIEYLRSDLAELISGVLESIADCQKALGATAQARTYYERAIQEAEDYQLSTLVRRYRLKLAELLFARAGDYDRALRDLLPMRQQMGDDEPSLERVRVTLLLAETCVNAGDLFEAEQMLTAVEEDLGRLGYETPNSENLDGALAGWIETAGHTTKSPNAFREALYGVLTAYTSIANLRGKTEPSAEGKAAALALIEPLVHVKDELMARDQEIVERDQRTIARLAERFAPESPGESPAPGAEWSVFQREWGLLAERVVALRAGIEAGESPEPLLAEAMSLAEEARRLNDRRLAGSVLDIQGDLLLQLGHQDEAVQAWREANVNAAQAGHLEDALYMLTKIAGAFAAQGDHAAVSAACGEAIDLVERYRYNLSPTYQQSAFLQQKIHFYFLGVFSAYKMGDYDLMLRRMELSKARASLRTLLQRPVEGADAGSEALEKEIREINAALDGADAEAAKALRARRRTLWDLLAIRRAEANRQQLPPEFSLGAVQEALEPDEAAVCYYWLRPGVLMVAALDRERIEVTRQILEDEEYAGLVALIDELGKMQRLKINAARLDSFSPHLLPEPVRSVLSGKKRVLFSPHRLLHLFPFHALHWDGEYLITRLAVSYVPNLTSLLVRFPPGGGRHALAVGAEHFAVPGLSLNPLPGAALEVDDLHALYAQRGIPMEVLRDEAASLRRLREWAEEGRLSSYGVLHFAIHGQDVLGDTPMETYLCLYDGLLDGLEIAGWHLHAELVVLSACHSGRRAFRGRGLEELPGDEMFGLQAAFFSAGARCVIGALWPAHDRAARSIMVAFHRHAAHSTPEFALQAAILDFLRDASLVTRNPAYWAPFVISAVGRAQQRTLLT